MIIQCFQESLHNFFGEIAISVAKKIWVLSTKKNLGQPLLLANSCICLLAILHQHTVTMLRLQRTTDLASERQSCSGRPELGAPLFSSMTWEPWRAARLVPGATVGQPPLLNQWPRLSSRTEWTQLLDSCVRGIEVTIGLSNFWVLYSILKLFYNGICSC